jgi:cytosine/adenosine deaminase-related metal-dependent hydrolase
MGRLLVRGGTILSMDDATGDFPEGDILIDGDTIAAIGVGLSADGAEVIDAPGMIVMPGLVDAHLHTWQTAIRGIAGDWSLMEYGQRMHAGLAKQYTPDDIYIATLGGALNQINCGVTTLFDWSHNNPTPAHSDRAIDALEESGIRAVFGHGTPKPSLDAGGVPTSELLHPEDEVRRLRQERISGDGGLLTMALCIRGPDLSSYEATEHDVRLAYRHGLFASAHLGGRVLANRKTPDGLFRLAEAGLLGPDFNSVHSNKLRDEELKVMVDAGVSFTVTPEVEMQMGHGLPITGRLLALGKEPSIGIDIETGIGTEMLWAARFALQVQRGLDNVAVNATGSEVERVSITTRQALGWATLEAARALRLDGVTGSLRVGKEADVILIRASDLNVFPAALPQEAVLYHSNSGNVDTVIVAGKCRKRNGRLTYPDLQLRKEQLAESGRRLLHDAGIL